MSFVGDILLDRGVRDRMEQIGYDRLYEEVAGRLHTADYLIGNLECPVTEIREPVTKKYIFRGDKENLEYLKKVGFTHLNLANNHSYDQGRRGLADTDKNLRSSGIIPLGYGKGHADACEPVIISKNGLSVAVYSTVVLPLENWVVLDGEPAICQARPEELAAHIEQFRKGRPGTRVIVQLHWGLEHRPHPTTDQKKWAHELIDAGADVIIGHHSHVIQSIEKYKGKYIYYGIGNCLFDQKRERNKKGLQVFVTISPDSVMTASRVYRTDY